MNWDENYVPQLERTISQRVKSAGYYLLSEIRQVVSVAGRTVTHVPITRGKNKGKTKKVVGALGSNSSKPGEAPHRQKGRYRASLAQAHDDGAMLSRVGSPMKLALWLEKGTAKMAARPHLRATLEAHKDAIVKIISTGNEK